MTNENIKLECLKLAVDFAKTIIGKGAEASEDDVIAASQKFYNFIMATEEKSNG